MPYRTELKRPDLKGNFRCSICLKMFCHSSSLSRHRMQAHFKSYTCTICDKDITSNETLRAHMYKQHQISRMFMCRCCNFAFPDKTGLHMHMQSMAASGKPGTANAEARRLMRQHKNNHNLNVQNNNFNSTMNSMVNNNNHNNGNNQSPISQVMSNNSTSPNSISTNTSMTQMLLQAAQRLNGGAPLPNAPQSKPLNTPSQPLSNLFPNGLFPSLPQQAPPQSPQEFFNRLRERLILNAAMSAQSNNNQVANGLNLASLLSNFPKVDPSGVSSLGGSLNLTTEDHNDDDIEHKALQIDERSPRSSGESFVDVEEHVDPVSSPEAGEEQDALLNDHTMNDSNMSIKSEPHFMDTSSSACGALDLQRCHSQPQTIIQSPGAKSHNSENNTPSVVTSTCNTSLGNGSTTNQNTANVVKSMNDLMPTLRSAIESSPLNSLLYKRKWNNPGVVQAPGQTMLEPRQFQTNSYTVSNTSVAHDEEACDRAHISPSDTTGSNSPGSHNCFECQLYKGRLQLTDNRNKFLETKTNKLETEANQINARVQSLSNSLAQLDKESRQMRVQNDSLQRKLLQCQEKTILLMQNSGANPLLMQQFLTEILHTTLINKMD